MKKEKVKQNNMRLKLKEKTEAMNECVRVRGFAICRQK
jgi:hypothetical protein